MANSFKLELVTPLAKILSEEVNFVMLRTTEGDMGILPNHSPFVAGLATGEMKIRNNGQENFYYVSGGFVEISDNVVTILADEAMDIKDIDLEAARKEAQIAKEKLEKIAEDIDIATVQKSLTQALTKVKLAEKML
ncbi:MULTISPECIES: F0F1 ATP synthase subunit epsilon [Cetobacterium]|jgi:F-type H+-transporting ATPase subunit epsilon|uniref:ATP synthase epsilon chain n=1 Tax=Candidatus Cetobacterium colombiensis TaxID=3073100 RepID=A0ABU4W9V1_9FUSO|nr:F0F1 ATP synthase subunit epsilon [Candidatus Cetobacterium colombiensis]MDX8336313.1 F0F1 ATP synthase subunit epsilon [Candidatus Cetobacterium colombiensis]